MERDEGVGDKDENDWERVSRESDRMRKRESRRTTNGLRCVIKVLGC